MALLVIVELEGVEGQEDEDASLSATGVAGINDTLVRELLLVTSQPKWEQGYQGIVSVVRLSIRLQPIKWLAARHRAMHFCD